MSCNSTPVAAEYFTKLHLPPQVHCNISLSPTTLRRCTKQLKYALESIDVQSVAHQAVSFAKEVVQLLRHMIHHSNWKQSLQQLIGETLETIPSLLER